MVTKINWTALVPLSAANLDQQEQNSLNITTGHSHDGVDSKLNSLLGKFKIGNFQRDISIASGSQIITGLGFQPSVLVFFNSGAAYLADQHFYWSHGFDDGTTAYCNAATRVSWGMNFFNTASIVVEFQAGGSYKGKISALGADGFTIDWTKVGLPTGTINITYLAFY